VRGNALRLNRVDTLVLDEADRMLDMGFIHDIRTIVAKLPRERQTLLFSATMPREIAELARQMLRDPAQVAVTPVASTAERVAQRIIHTDRAAKASLLVDVLKAETIDRALVFTRTKHGADKVVRGLVKSGIAAEAIHGNKSQNQRERVLADFRAGRVRTLVATDIAARGIDVSEITHVINYDLPEVPETYVHRIGRTARAGAEGIAISFCDADQVPLLRAIEKLIRQAIPASGRAAAQKPNGHKPHNGQRPHNGKPHNGRPHNGRPDNGQRPHNGQKAHGQKPHNGNGHKAGPPSHNGKAPRLAASATNYTGEIGTLSFMQRTERPDRNDRPRRDRSASQQAAR
jgi:ATP-dependent RNA helicase RhlE